MEQTKEVIQHKGFGPFKNIHQHVLLIWQDQLLHVLQASTVEDIPGRPQSLQGKVMEQAEGAIQRFSPFQKIHQHVCGFHFYAHDITRQVIGIAQSWLKRVSMAAVHFILEAVLLQQCSSSLPALCHIVRH